VFTLVELIVVITILAILWTIAFISMQSYSSNARDSTRISDLSAMKTSLELFQLDSWKYPEPTEGFVVSYSWSEVWTQWTFWTTTFSNISKLDKIPTDPLTEKEYTYSVTKTKQEYQFAWIVEWDEISYNPLPNPPLSGEGIATLISQTNAGDLVATALVTWTYNGQMLKTENWINCNILSLPSIISSEPNTVTDLWIILTNKSLVYNWYENLPTNYITTKYKTDWWFPFESNKQIVYDDSASCMPLYNPEDNTARIELLTNLQEAYSWTLIENEDDIIWVVNIDLTDTGSLDVIAATFVNNNLGGDLAISTSISNWWIWWGGETPPTLTQWRDIPWTYCTNDDISIWWMTWAWCNSVLGITGINNINEDVYNWICRSYSLSQTSVNCNATYLSYTALENSYNSLKWIDNIWGKLYTWSNASSACPIWWHLPSDNDFETLETVLNWWDNCRMWLEWAACYWLGWWFHGTKDETNNIINALKLPLSGGYYYDNYSSLGQNWALWSSTEQDSINAWYRLFPYRYDYVNRNKGSKNSGLSVRCIKDLN